MRRAGLSASAELLVKSRDYVFKMSILKKLSIVLYSVHWLHVRTIKKLILRAAFLSNRSITATMLYACQIGGFVAS